MENIKELIDLETKYFELSQQKGVSWPWRKAYERLSLAYTNLIGLKQRCSLEQNKEEWDK